MSYVFSKALQGEKKPAAIQLTGKIPPPIMSKPHKHDGAEKPMNQSGSLPAKKPVHRAASFDLTQLGGGEWKQKVIEKEQQRLEEERKETEETERLEVETSEQGKETEETPHLAAGTSEEAGRKNSLEKKGPPVAPRRKSFETKSPTAPTATESSKMADVTATATESSKMADVTDSTSSTDRKSSLPLNLPKPRKISMELKKSDSTAPRRHSSSFSGSRLVGGVELKRGSDLLKQVSFDNTLDSKTPYFRRVSRAISSELEETIAECESSLKDMEVSGEDRNDKEEFTANDGVVVSPTNNIEESEESADVATMKEEIAVERTKEELRKKELTDAISEIDSIAIDLDHSTKSTGDAALNVSENSTDQHRPSENETVTDDSLLADTKADEIQGGIIGHEASCSPSDLGSSAEVSGASESLEISNMVCEEESSNDPANGKSTSNGQNTGEISIEHEGECSGPDVTKDISAETASENHPMDVPSMELPSEDAKNHSADVAAEEIPLVEQCSKNIISPDIAPNEEICDDAEVKVHLSNEHESIENISTEPDASENIPSELISQNNLSAEPENINIIPGLSDESKILDDERKSAPPSNDGSGQNERAEDINLGSQPAVASSEIIPTEPETINVNGYVAQPIKNISNTSVEHKSEENIPNELSSMKNASSEQASSEIVQDMCVTENSVENISEENECPHVNTKVLGETCGASPVMNNIQETV